MIRELEESELLDLLAQFDDVSPNDSVVIDVGVVQSLTTMAQRGLEMATPNESAVAKMRRDERERCARIAEDPRKSFASPLARSQIAAAIRAGAGK